MLIRGRWPSDPADGAAGSIIVLVVGYTAIAMALILLGVDTSRVFLARRALSSAADSAALAGSQGVDRAALYAGPPLRCGRPLPLAPGRAAALVAASVAGDRAQLGRWFTDAVQPRTSSVGGTVTVVLTGQVGVPFRRILGWLDPAHRAGVVTVSQVAHARSPVEGGGC
jgi:Putative Flp pilus-assembly TadE/G-like